MLRVFFLTSLLMLSGCATASASSADASAARSNQRSKGQRKGKGTGQKTKGAKARAATGVLHTVQAGETLWKISRAYGVSIEDIVTANELKTDSRIARGQKLFIPGAKALVSTSAGKTAQAQKSPKAPPAPAPAPATSRPKKEQPKPPSAPSPSAQPATKPEPSPAISAPRPEPKNDPANEKVSPAAPPPAPPSTQQKPSPAPYLPVDEGVSRQYAPPPPAKDKPLNWPVRGVIYARFGKRGQSVHDGIDIAAPDATPIRAAGDGKVLFSAVQSGYGNLIIIEHAGGLLTLYAHNRENLVKEGDKVRMGQVIARMGESSPTSGPYLHFEVRVHSTPKNPLDYMPPPR